jgi:hypothetical protein
VFGKDDSEPYFLYGQCALRGKAKIARLTIEADPKPFAQAIGNGEYIDLRLVDSRAPRDFIVEKLTLNEVGPHLWSLEVEVEQQFFDQLLEARSVVLALGLKGRDSDFKEKRRFRLRDDNRRAAIGAFIKACFKAAS